MTPVLGWEMVPDPEHHGGLGQGEMGGYDPSSLTCTGLEAAGFKMLKFFLQKCMMPCVERLEAAAASAAALEEPGRLGCPGTTFCVSWWA